MMSKMKYLCRMSHTEQNESSRYLPNVEVGILSNENGYKMNVKIREKA
jgi:hypothetical protein